MIKLVESECDCKRCSAMCQAPCCPTPAEVEKLIKAGFGNRLMIDDDPNDVCSDPVIKPALKGWEGQRAPYQVASSEGCTFWKKGKCGLHKLGLKPFTGRYAHHDASREHWHAVCEKLKKTWRTKKASVVIKKFMKLFGISKREE